MNNITRVFLQEHESIAFEFTQNKEDFIVEELFAKPFGEKGNFLILHVKKINMTTWELIEKIATFLNIHESEIGYAGLKDKYATTMQYLSLPLQYEKQLTKFREKQIEILKTFKAKERISIGDLSANRFKIRLHKVDDIKAGKIEKMARVLEKTGFANYFGYQRFGQDSLKQAFEMIEGELFIKDKKVKKFLTSVYQSYLFNNWLKTRVELSRENGGKTFLLFNGDVMIDENEKLTTPKTAARKEFLDKKLIPTGLLVGRNIFRAKDDAREIELKFDDELLSEKGFRRRAWVYPKELTCKYNKKDGDFELSFVLPKASYATVFIENIANRNFE
jgi:tRNA pseudouridine13 synthase